MTLKHTMTFIGSLGLMTLLAIVSPAFADSRQDGTSEEKAEPSLEEVKREAEELLRAIEAYTVEQRDEALEDTKAALDRLDERIDALEARIDAHWDDMNAAARKKARASLKALRKQRTRVAEWYGGMKNSSRAAWGRLRQGFVDACRELKDAWEEAEEEFDAADQQADTPPES